MTAKRSIRDLERQCKKEPDNLVVRLLLAAALREAGRTGEAIPLYRSVADTYQRQGRRTQAVAVLKSLLEIDSDPTTRALADQLDRESSGAMVAIEAPADPPGMPPPPSATPEETPRPPGARVLAQDVVVRELTPVRPPGVPATVRTMPSAPLDMPGVRRLSTPGRGSAPSYTPTPLPTPMPFHEADGTMDHERTSDPELHDPDEAMTRVADGFRMPRTGLTPPPLRPVTDPGHPAPTRPASTGEITAPDLDLASDLDTRPVRRLSEAELDAIGLPPPGMTAPAPRFDSSDLEPDTNPDHAPHHAPRGADDHDDEPTRYAGDRGVPASELEGPTGVRSPRERKPARSPTTVTSATSKTPAPAAPRHRAASAIDGGGSDPDEPTRIAPPAVGVPADRDTSPITRDSAPVTRDTAPMAEPAAAVAAASPPPGDEATEIRDPGVRVSEPGMHRSKTFAESYAGTLEELDPDGASIEAPLDVFSMLPPEALAELGRRMILRHHAAGELVIREGEPGDACYVIADGEVRVLKNDPLTPDAGPVEVARLGPRSLFGEFALLADRRRHATVQATSHVSVYEIPRQLLRELAASYPEVGPALDTFYRQRLLATLLRTAPFFTPLPEEQRVQLLARFVPIRAESGEPIVREGRPAGGLYLIVIGAVEITRRLGKHRSVILATLREGAYFGEMSLLSGEPTNATVVAAGPVELALLPPRDFYDIVSAHPELWASIRREARTRALENARLLAGETGTV